MSGLSLSELQKIALFFKRMNKFDVHLGYVFRKELLQNRYFDISLKQKQKKYKPA